MARLPHYFDRWRRYRTGAIAIWGCCLGLLLCLLLGSQTGVAIAQENPNRALIEAGKSAVILDGRYLFEVGPSGTFSARERANIINDTLQALVQDPTTVALRVDGTDPPVTIQTDQGQVIVTVTKGDVIPGNTPVSQAYRWRSLLTETIQMGQLQRSPAYRRQALTYAAIALLTALLFHLLSRFGGQVLTLRLRRWLGRPTSPWHAWEQSVRLLVQLAIIGVQAGLWIAVLLYVTDLFPETRTFWLFLNSPILPLGENQYSAFDLLRLIASIVVLWFVINALTRFLRSYVLSQTGADSALQEVVSVITQYTLTFLGLIIILQIWEFDVSSLTILASILGVGIGFGVQNIANNFISGIIITLERPIQVGDFVNVGSLTGTVERVGARSTEIRTMDRVTIIVPNSKFLENEVINWSHGDATSRLHIPVGVAYGSDINRVQTALLEAARSHPEVLLSPRPQVWFQAFGESSLDFELLVWTGDPKQQLRIKSDLNYRIAASLQRHNIEVPFPQRDLHLRSPQLDQLLTVWLQQAQTPAIAPEPELPPVADVVMEPTTDLPTSPPEAAPRDRHPSLLSRTDLAAIAEKMQGEAGVEVRDRRYLLTLYPDCFVGAEAVDWLMQHCQQARPEALAIGQLLMDYHFIHHVTRTEPFKDGYFFYRFREA